MVSDRLRKTYDLQVSKAGALERHRGFLRFTLNYMEPKLRSELDRRIMASADLIKLNRTAAINKTCRGFSGWANQYTLQDSIAADRHSSGTINYNGGSHPEEPPSRWTGEARRDD